MRRKFADNPGLSTAATRERSAVFILGFILKSAYVITSSSATQCARNGELLSASTFFTAKNTEEWRAPRALSYT